MPACTKFAERNDPRYSDCVRCGFMLEAHNTPPATPAKTSPIPTGVVQFYRNEFGGLQIVRPS